MLLAMGETTERYEPAKGEHPIRGHIRAAGFDRVSHGLFLPSSKRDDPDEQWHRLLHAWQQVLPENAVFTHVTGARLYGWDLPKLPEHVPVFAAVGTEDKRPRREGLICSRLTRPTSTRRRHGLPVEEPVEILLRASRDLGVLDMVIMIDAAFRAGDLTDVETRAILASGRPGVGVLRAAYELSEAKHESAMESVLGVFHAAMDIVSEPQVDLYDDHGTYLGRADRLVTGTEWLHEYDGKEHRRKERHRQDLRRDRNLANSPYRRKGFSLDDLLNHAAVVMHEVDRDLERPHVNARLRRWRILVRESMYSEVGRARVLNRWSRAMGVVQWS